MDNATLSRHAHLTWMQFFLRVPADRRRLTLQMRGTTCGVSLAMNGRRSASRVTYAQELQWTETSGMVSCVPADGQQHSYAMTSDVGCDLFVTLIPKGHIETVAVDEGVKASMDWSPLLGSHDAVIRTCMARLAAIQTSPNSAGNACIDEVARRLIIRLVELTGGGKPQWINDASTFEHRTLLNLVDYVDEHLCTAAPLTDMAVLAGMSPSHFAKKFRQSTGLSLLRFMNRRRILRSLETLRTDASLASIAYDLGFSSQSHFARTFSGLTGMTPANYRKQVRPVVG